MSSDLYQNANLSHSGCFWEREGGGWSVFKLAIAQLVLTDRECVFTYSDHKPYFSDVEMGQGLYTAHEGGAEEGL